MMLLKRTLYVLLAALPVLAFVDIQSNGAPASSSGAPGEANCTKSGCHQDFAVNSGPGTSSLQITGGMTTYVPGMTYTLTAQISQTNLHRFGFQVLALADMDSSNTGTFQLSQGSRTQIIPGNGTLASRNYMTYTYAGTTALSPGFDQWSFQWTAPQTDKGPVTFYLATIAANDDGTDNGDYGYTTLLKLQASPAGIHELSSALNLQVFPNPVSEHMVVSYSLKQASAVKMELYSVNGQKVEEWISGMQAAGSYTKTMELKRALPEGVYLLKLTENEQAVTKKIFIKH
jgi:hypothetical protein